MDDNFYNQLPELEQQVCDLCRDWNLEDCERCTIVSRNSLKNNRQEARDMNVVLYTIDCPNCMVLEKKLNDKKIEYTRISDKDTIIAEGYGDSTFPILKVEGVEMNYKTAISWINNQ